MNQHAIGIEEVTVSHHILTITPVMYKFGVRNVCVAAIKCQPRGGSKSQTLLSSFVTTRKEF